MVAVHFTWVRDEPAIRAVLPAVEALLLPLGARPHWGKLFVTDAAELERLFPRLPEVAAMIIAADPDQKFGNDYLDRYVTTRPTVNA